MRDACLAHVCCLVHVQRMPGKCLRQVKEATEGDEPSSFWVVCVQHAHMHASIHACTHAYLYVHGHVLVCACTGVHEGNSRCGIGLAVVRADGSQASEAVL